MQIGVIGTGRIGTTLAQQWSRRGHDVVSGSRSPSRDQVDVASALAREVVVLAVPGGVVPELLRTRASILAGRLVIDATNSVGSPALHHAAAAAAVPGLRYVRAFNTLGVENVADPIIGGQQADLFYSGPEADRPVVETLIADIGLRPVWVGDGPAAADVVDGVTRLWFALALQRGLGRHLAFRMLP